MGRRDGVICCRRQVKTSILFVYQNTSALLVEVYIIVEKSFRAINYIQTYYENFYIRYTMAAELARRNKRAIMSANCLVLIMP